MHRAALPAAAVAGATLASKSQALQHRHCCPERPRRFRLPLLTAVAAGLATAMGGAGPGRVQGRWHSCRWEGALITSGSEDQERRPGSHSKQPSNKTSCRCRCICTCARPQTSAPRTQWMDRTRNHATLPAAPAYICSDGGKARCQLRTGQPTAGSRGGLARPTHLGSCVPPSAATAQRSSGGSAAASPAGLHVSISRKSARSVGSSRRRRPAFACTFGGGVGWR